MLIITLLFKITAYAVPTKSDDVHLQIDEWWLPNQEERQHGMERYLRVHHGTEAPKDLNPQMVVVHWTGSSTAKSTWHTFASATLSGRRDIQSSGAVNVSAHYLVERDGTIHQLLPSTAFARHCIGFNHVAIGIENVGGNKTHPLTEAQVHSNSLLIQYLMMNHSIQLVIGHYESKDFEDHALFRETDPNYRSIKGDPGEDFMEALRIELTMSMLEDGDTTTQLTTFPLQENGPSK
mgnify:CR=1 FL=1